MGKKFLRILLKVLAGLLSILLIAAVGFLLILAQTKADETEKAEPQPLLAASPAVNISRETDLYSLVEGFPAPVLCFMSGSGMSFVSGTAADAALQGGFGRVATLYWQTADGEPMILRSIYPASALSLLESGYHFSTVPGPVLFGMDSVRMEKEDTVRVHAATDNGLYEVTVPKALAPKLSSLCRSLQLFSVKGSRPD